MTSATVAAAAWVAAIAATVSAIVASSPALRRFVFRPVRWVFNRLVGEPVTAWVHETIGGIVDSRISPALQVIAEAYKPNGGPSLPEQIAQMHHELMDGDGYVHTNIHALRNEAARLTGAGQATGQVVEALRETVAQMRTTGAEMTKAAASIVEQRND